MPKYVASIGYRIELRLSVVIQEIEENHSKEEKFVDDYAVGCDAGEKEAYAEWLTEEAVRQAQKVVESSLIMRGMDPEGISICEEGLYSVDVEDEVEDWRELYDNISNGELNWSYELPLLATAGSSAEVILRKQKMGHTQQEDVLYAQADAHAREIREQIVSMVMLTEQLPKGWKMLGKIEVSRGDVSVYEHKKWYEMTTPGGRGKSFRLIDRPPEKPTNYRRK